MSYKIENTDLVPSSSTKRVDDIPMQWAFTQAQLVIYRKRDKDYRSDTETFKLLTDLAEEINQIAQKWNDFNNEKSPQ